MPLLKLSGIGKIYYSEGNVAVGIRGIDLAFERGEFVAVTGASGSGKSTLLNVISGMDSYEEGELYIEDCPTSHYLESDWEEYRSKYISFIFQDYNILESYTVLQNVELALMHIKDKRERRKRAVELLTRVGMEKHLRQKGSKLSGGQKQRTVIARALAKDSPIILADEPTGNLDEATSKEIIELLREVSKDKLLIVVTHNYEEVEGYATRHIRIFDGALEFDRGEKPAGRSAREERTVDYAPAEKKRFDLRSFMRDLGDGIALGGHVFTSRPKLAVFTCLLMTVGMLGIFLLTSVCFNQEIAELVEYNMFEHYNGRVVVVRRDGEIPTEDEISSLAQEYGAKKYVTRDYLLDNTSIVDNRSGNGDSVFALSPGSSGTITFIRPLDSGFSGRLEGRLPEKDNEVALKTRISHKKHYENMILGKSTVYIEGIPFILTGICYYYDNNLTDEAYVTESSFADLSALAALNNSSSITISRYSEFGVEQFSLGRFNYAVSDALGDKIYFSPNYFSSPDKFTSFTISLDSTGIIAEYGSDRIVTELTNSQGNLNSQYYEVILGADLITELARKNAENNYKQFSLFFKNDAEAKRAAERLLKNGYIAVLSNSTYAPDPFEGFVYGFLFFMMFAIWLGGVLCLAFFIRICQSRSIVSFKNDIAIMRSMGIKASVIKVSMYTRSVIAMIPAVFALFGVAALIFTSPVLNSNFTYLYGWQYALICAGLLIIAILVSYKQQSKLFAGSVKKTLTGGELND